MIASRLPAGRFRGREHELPVSPFQPQQPAAQVGPGVDAQQRSVLLRWRLRRSARGEPPVLRQPAGESRELHAEGGAARGPVDQHDGPDLAHRIEADGAGEPRDPAGVPDPGHLLAAGTAPGNAPRLRPPVIGQVSRFVHLTQRPGVQHLTGHSRLPVGPELERNPGSQVRGGRPQAAFRPYRRHGRRRVQVVRQAAPVVARRAPGDQRGRKRGKPVAARPSGRRMASLTYSGYGVPLARVTISPSHW